DIDFELELIHRDEINVTYILQLLAKMMEAPQAEKEKRKKAILDMIANETQLRSKRELIEKFIRENLPDIDDPDDVPAEFEKFWGAERVAFFDSLCEEENLDSERTSDLIKEFLYTEKEPLTDEVVGALNFKPTLLQRRKIAERVSDKLKSFVQLFVQGV
ncbi:MAG: type I restriction endonuclease subunit R, EcoR124 family, partial [Bacteroidales bacterium]